MMALVFGLLLMPACAAFAGFAIWAGYRKHALPDSDLIQHFIVAFGICLAIAWGIGRTDAVRLRIDPQYRLQMELEAHPVYAAIKRTSPDDHKELLVFLAGQLSQKKKLPDAFLQARPLLTRLANKRSGFADQKTRLAWGLVTVDSLRELQARDPALCYRAMASRLDDPQTLAQAFSAGNTKAFESTVVKVYESAARGIRNERSPDDIPVEFHQAALEYSVIQGVIVQKFGQPVSTQLARRMFLDPPMEPAEQMCAARIFQLDSMLERPQGMAAALIDSVLR